MEPANKNSGSWGGVILIWLMAISLIVGAFLLSNRSNDQDTGSWVDPYVTRSGKMVPGHYRKEYSTDPDAVRNRVRSNYYYHTQGKYRRKK